MRCGAPLFVPAGRDERDEDACLAQGGEFGDGAGAAARDDDVRGAQDVGQIAVDVVDDPVPAAQVCREGGRDLPHPAEGVVAALVQHLTGLQESGEDVADQVVDLDGALGAAGDVHQWQARIQVVCGERTVAVSREDLGPDRVAGDHRAGSRSGGQMVDGGLVTEQDSFGEVGENPVRQPEREDLLVHDQRTAGHPGRDPDRDGDVSAGGEDHLGPGAHHDHDGLEDAEGHAEGVRDVTAPLVQVRRAAQFAGGDRREGNVLVPGDSGLQSVGDAHPADVRCGAGCRQPVAERTDRGQRRVGVSAGSPTGDDHAQTTEMFRGVDGHQQGLG